MQSLFCIVGFFLFLTLIYIFKKGRACLGGMFLMVVIVVDVPSLSLVTFCGVILPCAMPVFPCVSAVSQRRTFLLPSQTLSSLVRTALLQLLSGFPGSAPSSSPFLHVLHPCSCTPLFACLLTVPSSVSFLWDLWFSELSPFPPPVPLLGVSLAHLSFSFAASFSCLSIGTGTANITKIIALRTGGSCAEDGLWICPECLGSIGNRSQLYCWRGFYISGTRADVPELCALSLIPTSSSACLTTLQRIDTCIFYFMDFFAVRMCVRFSFHQSGTPEGHSFISQPSSAVVWQRWSSWSWGNGT